jgi:phage regulator Rha-like protein
MCENNNNNVIDQELLDLSHSLKAAYKALDAYSNKSCMTQMQQKRFDLDILDAEAIRVCKFSTELIAYSFKIKNILKKLSAARNLWVKLNGITKEQADELDKKLEESCDKAVKEFKAHLEELIDG